MTDSNGHAIDVETTDAAPARQETQLARIGEDIAALEEAARAAKRRRDAIMQICVHSTYPTDWTRFGDFCGLSAAGADRIARAAGGFTFEIVDLRKEVGTNKHGAFFKYVCHARATYNPTGEQTEAIEEYSSQEKLHGYAHGKYRDPDDVREAFIRKAAKHIACGECVKTILGLRRVPADVLDRAGFPVKEIRLGEAGKVDGGGSSAAGASAKKTERTDDEKGTQIAIWNMLLEMNGGDQEAAKGQLKQLTTFQGKDGEDVWVKSLERCTGKWLQTTYGKVKEAHEAFRSASAEAEMGERF